jgi:Arc/MetJ-type ribon-helix-helix transcriptional regulator
MRKQRMTVTIDDALVRAGEAAVASGRASSLSAWVNAALVDRAEQDRRQAAMAAAVADYEAEHGVITLEEIAAQRRADRLAARRVGPKRRAPTASPRRKRAA